MRLSTLNLYAGRLACLTLVTYLLSVANLLYAEVSTILAWLTLVAILPRVSLSAKKQAAALLIIGIGCLLIGYLNGASIHWNKVFSTNVSLLSMFVAISFLSLTSTSNTDEKLPTGKRAAIMTAFGTSLLGAVINISVVFVFGDRLKRNHTLTDAQQILLARCFTATAWWSPFFIATGVTLMYAPGMSWKSSALPGIIMTLLSIGYTMLDLKRRGFESFEGYPIKSGNLMIPVLMAVSVLIGHHIFPNVSIMILISLLSIIGTVLFIQERPRYQAAKNFIDHRLHNTGSQFALFLAAGVFSAGLSMIISLNNDLIDLYRFQFDTSLFAIISALMILVGLLGVHPLVSIVVASPVLLPLNPDPSSLGFMFLTVWAVSTGSSPLSGIGLLLSGRYGASSMRIFQNNWHYMISMWAMACLVNFLIF